MEIRRVRLDKYGFFKWIDDEPLKKPTNELLCCCQAAVALPAHKKGITAQEKKFLEALDRWYSGGYLACSIFEKCKACGQWQSIEHYNACESVEDIIRELETFGCWAKLAKKARQAYEQI
jgi:hypothetical protein